MKDWLFHFLINFRGPAAYIGVLFVLITCGLGVPLPEDVPLITGGWLAGRGGSLPLMIFTGLAGILIGDSIIFRAGQVYGEKLLETRLGKHIPGERVQRTIAAFEKHGAKFIIAARFVPGLRAVTYFVAGLTGVPYWKFITFDGIAACVSAPAWVYLGWWARKHKMLNKVFAWSSQVQLDVLAVIAGLVAIYVIIARLHRRTRRRRGLPVSTPPAVPLQAIDGGLERKAARRP
ncbi:MAG TPA: DedA family protein [Myxococcales bacterium]|nr:DedA family protein [Myxococcales bacterium]